jgi:hypothetical protein
LKALAVVVVLTVGTLLGCGDAETASTDTAVTETIAPGSEEAAPHPVETDTASTAEPAPEEVTRGGN